MESMEKLISNLREITEAIGGFAFILFFADMVGRTILKPFNFKKIMAVRIGLGLGVISHTVFILGYVKGLYPYYLLLYSFIICVSLFLFNYKEFISNFFNPFPLFKKNTTIPINILVVVLFAYFFLIFIQALSPPLSRDALNYHLFLPKTWLKHGYIFTIPSNIYSFFPQFWETLYLYVLIVGNDISAKLLHAFTLFLSIGMLGEILKLIFPRLLTKYILLSSLIFVSTPTLGRVSSWAYVDVTQVFYILLSLHFLFYFLLAGNKNRLSFFLSSIFLGFALSIKYLSLIWLLGMPCFIIEKKKFCPAIKLTVVYILLAIIFAFPYYGRNYLETGNPFYPFLGNFLGSNPFSPEKSQLLYLYFKSFGYGESIKDLMLLPLRLSFFPGFDNPQRFDGYLGAFYLFLVILMFIKHKKIDFPLRSGIYFFIIYLLLWFSLSQQIRFLLCGAILLLIIGSGILSQFRWQYTSIAVVGLSIYYLFYPISTIMKEKPHYFILGKETREEFLQRNINIYSLIKKINKEVSTESKVMLLNVEPIAYYVESEVYQESIFQDYTFREKLKGGIDSLREFLKAEGITHILVNELRTKLHFLRIEEREIIKRYEYFKKYYLSPKIKGGEFTFYKVNL